MLSADRVILHFDIDCFYAQVEELRRPEYRGLPLGVTQKFLVITCNYAARAAGVTKLMRIPEALAKCPALVLVSGEDLTPYREASAAAARALGAFGPCERFATDEFFVDVSAEARRMARAGAGGLRWHGHVHSAATPITTAEEGVGRDFAFRVMDLRCVEAVGGLRAGAPDAAAPRRGGDGAANGPGPGPLPRTGPNAALGPDPKPSPNGGSDACGASAPVEGGGAGAADGGPVGSAPDRRPDSGSRRASPTLNPLPSTPQSVARAHRSCAHVPPPSAGAVPCHCSAPRGAAAHVLAPDHSPLDGPLRFERLAEDEPFWDDEGDAEVCDRDDGPPPSKHDPHDAPCLRQNMSPNPNSHTPYTDAAPDPDPSPNVRSLDPTAPNPDLTASARSPTAGATHNTSVSKSDLLLMAGTAIALRARAALADPTGLRCAAGIAHNRLLAKLCSGLHKPADQTALPAREAAAFLAPLAVRVLPGVGGKAGRVLADAGFFTVHDLRGVPGSALPPELPAALRRALPQLCLGIDPSPVVPMRPPQRLSVEDSFKGCTSFAGLGAVARVLAPDLVRRAYADRDAHARWPATLTVTWRVFGSATMNNPRGSAGRACTSRSTPMPALARGAGGPPDEQLRWARAVLEATEDVLRRHLSEPFHVTRLNLAVSNFQPVSTEAAVPALAPAPASATTLTVTAPPAALARAADTAAISASAPALACASAALHPGPRGGSCHEAHAAQTTPAPTAFRPGLDLHTAPVAGLGPKGLQPPPTPDGGATRVDERSARHADQSCESRVDYKSSAQHALLSKGAERQLREGGPVAPAQFVGPAAPRPTVRDWLRPRPKPQPRPEPTARRASGAAQAPRDAASAGLAAPDTVPIPNLHPSPSPSPSSNANTNASPSPNPKLRAPPPIPKPGLRLTPHPVPSTAPTPIPGADPAAVNGVQPGGVLPAIHRVPAPAPAAAPPPGPLAHAPGPPVVDGTSNTRCALATVPQRGLCRPSDSSLACPGARTDHALVQAPGLDPEPRCVSDHNAHATPPRVASVSSMTPHPAPDSSADSGARGSPDLRDKSHADRQFQCVECGQWLPLRLQQEHQDYHFAVALAGADGAMALPTDTGRSSVAGRPCTPQRSGAPQPRPRARPSLGKRPAPGVQTLGAWVVKRPRHAAD